MFLWTMDVTDLIVQQGLLGLVGQASPTLCACMRAPKDCVILRGF
jgi:hypothetical protein